MAGQFLWAFVASVFASALRISRMPSAQYALLHREEAFADTHLQASLE